MLRIVVLGAGAGGGVPQWNCNCEVCALARKNDGSVLPRSQSSIAVSGDGENWCILNCSPDIRQQLSDNRALWPKPDEHRHTPIASVVVTNADVDHIAGLLVLREKQAFDLFATGAVLEVLAENPIFNVLDGDFVARKPIEQNRAVDVGAALSIEPFLVPGKVALFNEQRMLDEKDTLDIGAESEDTVGLKVVSSGGESFFYVPGCAAMTDKLAARLKRAALVFFDGTVWQDDEMVARGLGAKTGGRMGHMSMAGAEGSMAAFEPLDVARKVFIHINNSNRVLIEGSEERRAANEAGWEIAYDGMEIEL